MAAKPPSKKPPDPSISGHLQAIVELTEDFVSWATPEGRILYINPAGRRIVGLADDVDVSETKIADFHPPETAELILALTQVPGEGGADGERRRAAEEAADLVYHVLVALLAKGVSLSDVLEELEGRR